MRIIAGQNRGLRLAEIGQGDHAAHLRPTTDRVRETLFNILRNWVDFQDLKVLDLFAGTGALGLEALSRGAQHVTFVENGRVGQKLIGDNIARMRAQDRCKLIAQDATKNATRSSFAIWCFWILPMVNPSGIRRCAALGRRAGSQPRPGSYLKRPAL